MRSNRAWIGVTCGVALGLAAVAAVDLSTQPASAQSANFTVSAEQLKINQNISSAAVRRSNRSLNYLAPIRTTATDNADNGSNGVKPLSGIPGAGQGWTIGQLAPGQKQNWANVTVTGTTAAISASSGPSSGTGAFTVTRAGVGNYVVNFQTNVSACSAQASATFAGTPTAHLAITGPVTGQPTQVDVRTFDFPVPPTPPPATPTSPAAPADTSFTIQTLC